MSTDTTRTSPPRPAAETGPGAPVGHAFPRDRDTPAPPRGGVFSDPDVALRGGAAPGPARPPAGRRVGEVMAGGVETARPGDTLQAAAEVMRRRGIGLLPVVDDGHLIGAVTARDITVRSAAAGGDPSRVMVHAVMSRDPVTCSADDDAAAVADRLRARRVRRVIVLDEGGRVVGVVSAADLAAGVSGAP